MSSALEALRNPPASIFEMRLSAAGPTGSLPLTEGLLLNSPSGDLFGMVQNAGMGWNPAAFQKKVPSAADVRSGCDVGAKVPTVPPRPVYTP